LHSTSPGCPLTHLPASQMFHPASLERVAS
jgi:hypothetical protein